MKRLLALGILLSLLVLITATVAADKASSSKADLQPLNDFIGQWKGNGSPPNARPGSRDFWSESVNWGWRFKGGDAWMNLEIKDGKYHKAGEVRFLPDKQVYQLTLTDTKDKKQVFEGKLENEVLVFERVNPDTKDGERIRINLAAEGIRMIYTFQRKPKGRTLFTTVYKVECTREGESLGSKEKKPECIVTGGLGTSTVSYKGQTFYVCCSGCRDAFNEDPEKFIKEFMAKKKKK